MAEESENEGAEPKKRWQKHERLSSSRVKSLNRTPNRCFAEGSDYITKREKCLSSGDFRHVKHMLLFLGWGVYQHVVEDYLKTRHMYTVYH